VSFQIWHLVFLENKQPGNHAEPIRIARDECGVVFTEFCVREGMKDMIWTINGLAYKTCAPTLWIHGPAYFGRIWFVFVTSNTAPVAIHTHKAIPIQYALEFLKFLVEVIVWIVLLIMTTIGYLHNKRTEILCVNMAIKHVQIIEMYIQMR
jgi:hypothetical protein